MPRQTGNLFVYPSLTSFPLLIFVNYFSSVYLYILVSVKILLIASRKKKANKTDLSNKKGIYWLI